MQIKISVAGDTFGAHNTRRCRWRKAKERERERKGEQEKGTEREKGSFCLKTRSVDAQCSLLLSPRCHPRSFPCRLSRYIFLRHRFTRRCDPPLCSGKFHGTLLSGPVGIARKIVRLFGIASGTGNSFLSRSFDVTARNFLRPKLVVVYPLFLFMSCISRSRIPICSVVVTR